MTVAGNDDDPASIRARGLAASGGSSMAKGVPTKVDRWRRENPDALRSWTTKYGCVVQFWGMRVYYGRCRECAGLVTARRGIAHNKRGRTDTGRYPELCAECKAAKEAEHSERARYRMAALRRERYGFRDEQYRKVGLPPVRQGVPADPTDYSDDWLDMVFYDD